MGDVATIVGGGTPSTNNDAYWDGDIDWYSPAELGERVYADRSVRRITQAGYDSCSATLLPAGKTILFTSRAGIGNTAILRRSACTNQGFQSLVVNDDTDVYFVYSMTDRIKKFAEQKASGSTFLEISGKGLAAGEFAFPSKDEQTAIGSMFKQLDHLITLHQRKRRKRLFTHLLVWEQRKLGDICERHKEMVPTPKDGYVRMGVRSHAKGTFLTMVKPGAEIEEKELSRVKAHCLVVNIVFAWEQAIAITSTEDEKALVSHRFPQFLFHDDMHPDYFRYAILNDSFERHLWLASPSGAGRNKTLNVGTMLEYSFTLPNKKEQEAIASCLTRLDSLITLHQ